MRNSTVAANISHFIHTGQGQGAGIGGSISNDSTATAIITNSTLSGNSASLNGGGIANAGTININNTTVSGNAADPIGSYGGGIGTSSGPAVLQNTIVANNSGRNCNGPITSNGYNLSSDNTCNFHNSGDRNNTNPMLGTLGNHGGPTQTIPLLSGSLLLMVATRAAAPMAKAIC